jgi:gliding motility-associated lipoprotein GldB
MYKYLLIPITFLLLACNSKSTLEKEIEAIPVEVKIVRFDKEFAAASPSDLVNLKSKFPVFFPQQYNDTIWEQKMTDTLQRQLSKEVEKIFPSETKMEEELQSIFQHIKYYFPQFQSPMVLTTTSDVDYKNKVVLAKDMLIISLDTYLGSDHEFYGGIKKYISQNLKESQFGPDIASAYARQLITKPSQRSFLAQMVYFGKELYLKDLWLPETSDAEKIGYTEEQLKWAQENEEFIWRYFVEREMLYSTSSKLPVQFINPAPFSKFYLEIDNESPGMIGRYLGWQIVRSYMKNNDASAQQLMIKNTNDLFTESKYKPAKQ